MKKAVIQTGSKQYIVQEGETLHVELLKQTGRGLTFDPLLVVDGDSVQVGKPVVASHKVKAEVVEEDRLSDKVMSVRYKAKKRVHKVHGHRQHLTTIKVVSISKT